MARHKNASQGQGQATWAGLVNENAALRSEVESLTRERDEIKLLQFQTQNRLTLLANANTALRAKLDKAREALDWIVEAPPSISAPSSVLAELMRSKARAALAEIGEKE